MFRNRQSWFNFVLFVVIFIAILSLGRVIQVVDPKKLVITFFKIIPQLRLNTQQAIIIINQSPLSVLNVIKIITLFQGS